MQKNSNYKPSEKQTKCKYSWPYIGENWDQTYCRKKMELTGKEEESFVTNEDCEHCPHYDSRFIEYPIQVNAIHTSKMQQSDMLHAGSLVAIRPVAEKYGGKTYLGLYLGNQPWKVHSSYHPETRILQVGAMTNPAIYVFTLHQVIFGAESWWKRISSPKDFAGISDAEIDGQWYVQMAKGLFGTEIPGQEKEKKKED